MLKLSFCLDNTVLRQNIKALIEQFIHLQNVLKKPEVNVTRAGTVAPPIFSNESLTSGCRP